MLIDQAELNDHGVILEYQLGNTSRRLDAMLTGHAATSAENAVVVELKQWGDDSIGPSTADGCVETFVGKQVRRVLHPSVQVGGYQQWLLDNHAVFYDDRCGRADRRQLPPQHAVRPEPASSGPTPRRGAPPPTRSSPATSRIELAEFLNHHLSAGDGIPVMSRVLESKYRPSKKLLDHTAAMIAASSEFVLLDEQRVAFESVLAAAREGYHDAKKSVVLVEGGPGTGKSVIALNLVGELAKRGYNALHATGSKAFTENMRRIVGSRAGVAVPLLQPVRQRRRERRRRPDPRRGASDPEDSTSRFTPKAKRTDLAQIDELLEAAKTSVFFIDDLQVVRPGEVGSTDLIREAADATAPRSAIRARDAVPLAGSKALHPAGSTTRSGSAETANPIWDGQRGVRLPDRRLGRAARRHDPLEGR